jgi:hypothetical protein
MDPGPISYPGLSPFSGPADLIPATPTPKHDMQPMISTLEGDCEVKDGVMGSSLDLHDEFGL